MTAHTKDLSARDPSLVGKVVVVTGSAGDLGHSITDQLSRAGAVTIGCDLAASSTVELCDVTDRGSVDALISTVLTRHGRLDALVACAGVVERCPATELPIDSWSRVIDINLTGAFNTAQAAAKAMSHSGGAIVFIGSWVGVSPARNLLSYCVSKAGIEMLARCLALELADRHIRVNVVAPGVVDAGVSSQIFREAPERRAAMEAAIPARRLAEVHDVTDCVEFLLSGRSAYVTGTTLLVDGGIHLAHAGG